MFPEIVISEEQRKRAEELYNFKVLNNSVTKGEGNKVGALGEIIVLDRYQPVTEYVGCYDYDLLIKDKKIDVKTKKQNYPPADCHTYNIFAYNITQKCDYYCFVVILSDLSKAWIVGWKNKEEFFKQAKFGKKGEIDYNIPNSTWKFREDCYYMNVLQLENNNVKIVAD